MAKCEQCGQDYEAKRSTSSYCSPKCKQEFYRNRISKPVTLSNAKPVTLTSQPKKDTKLNFNAGEVSRCSEMRDMKDVTGSPKRGKDKNKQREANKQASQRRRDKGMTQGITNQGMTARNGEGNVIPCSTKRGKDIKCFADLPPEDRPPDVQAMIEDVSKHGGEYSFKTVKGKIQDVHRTSPVTGKPGDADYNGVCTEAWRAERGR